MSPTKKALSVVGFLLLGAAFGSLGTRYFVQQRCRWEMAVTFSEITILTIDQLNQASLPKTEQARKDLFRGLVLCAQGSNRLVAKGDEAARIAKGTLKLIEPYMADPMYIHENLEPSLPFDQERNYYR